MWIWTTLNKWISVAKRAFAMGLCWAYGYSAPDMITYVRSSYNRNQVSIRDWTQGCGVCKRLLFNLFYFSFCALFAQPNFTHSESERFENLTRNSISQRDDGQLLNFGHYSIVDDYAFFVHSWKFTQSTKRYMSSVCVNSVSLGLGTNNRN